MCVCVRVSVCPCDAVGSSNPIKHLPATEDDPRKRRPDITLAKEKLGWSPKVTVEEGLQHTIDYFRQELYMTSDRTTVWITV